MTWCCVWPRECWGSSRVRAGTASLVTQPSQDQLLRGHTNITLSVAAEYSVTCKYQGLDYCFIKWVWLSRTLHDNDCIVKVFIEAKIQLKRKYLAEKNICVRSECSWSFPCYWDCALRLTHNTDTEWDTSCLTQASVRPPCSEHLGQEKEICRGPSGRR